MKNSQETKQSKFKHGDVIHLGNHILICGDSSKVDLGKILDGRSIQALITDPPYGVDYAASKRDFQPIAKDKDIANDGFMSDEQYISFTKGWFLPILPHFSKKNSIYIFNSDKMIFSLREACKSIGMKVAQLIIWIKDRAIIGRLDYLPQHELILYGWYGTHDFKRGKDKSVIFSPKPSKSKLHPTMKPISLMRKLILNSTDVGDTVYDPFGGSGSTLVACEQMCRKCITVEMDPDYCEVIVQRFEKITGQTYGKKDSSTTENRSE